MKKHFIHKKILDNEIENKDLILNINHKLIYHTKQLWNSFDDNDVDNFIKQLQWISEKCNIKSILFSQRFDKKGYIRLNCIMWMKVVMNDDKNEDFAKSINKYSFSALKAMSKPTDSAKNELSGQIQNFETIIDKWDPEKIDNINPIFRKKDWSERLTWS